MRRQDYRVRTTDGVGLRVRCVQEEGSSGEVIVLVHGIAAPLEPTYDLPVEGYSFMQELAQRGFRAVAFDHRNFGASDRASVMEAAPLPDLEGRGLQTLDESVEDIRAVIADTAVRYGVDQLTLFGSSRGAIQALGYAVEDGRYLRLAILNNPSALCYLSGVREGPLLAAMEAERQEARREHTFTLYTAEFQRKRWRKLFGDRQTVDAELQEAYIACCIASDAEGGRRNPPVFRVPTESFPVRVPLLKLEQLAVPVLVVEAEEVDPGHARAFLSAVPSDLGQLVHIRDSNHFTLRNARRFELANVIEVAIAGHRWGARSRARPGVA
jgi:pimeloyl-ACP methyl ester carboxylesterase